MSLQNRDRPPPYAPPDRAVQPDPMLKQGPMSPWVKWPMVAAALVLGGTVIYAIAHENDHLVRRAPVASDNNDRPPAQPLPGGRSTASAPRTPPVSKPVEPHG